MLHNTEDECEACALFDIAVGEPDGLCTVDNLVVAKRLVARIAVRLSLEELLTRIGKSEFPVELLRFLPHVYGSSPDDLRPVVNLLFEKGTDFFDTDVLTEFADIYYTTVVNIRIVASDYQRAYDEIKKAFRGMRIDSNRLSEDALIYPPEHGDPDDMTASIGCVRRLIHALHTSMYEAGLLQDILSSTRSRDYYCSDISGGLFAAAIEGSHLATTPVFRLTGAETIDIARYLKSKRTASRKKKMQRRIDAMADAA